MTSADNRDALLALAERCEAATTEDYGIDLAIARTLFGKNAAVKPYSGSLDAAMTLVPICPMAGEQRYAARLDSGFYGATAELWHECSTDRFHGHACGSHEGLPLALSAAALRARAAHD